MKRVRGFTLIELMIVVAVIAILAAVAVGQYNKQIRKSRRAEAKQVLADLSLRQEKWRSNHNKYLGADSTAANKTLFGAFGTSSYYTITLGTNESATDYTVTATPSGDQARDACGTLTLVMASGTVSKCPGGATCAATTPTDCW
jgi:type IV pilus assembly protein PilE